MDLSRCMGPWTRRGNPHISIELQTFSRRMFKFSNGQRTHLIYLQTKLCGSIVKYDVEKKNPENIVEVNWISLETEQKIMFQLQKFLILSIFGRFQRCIDACREIFKWLSLMSKAIPKTRRPYICFTYPPPPPLWREIKDVRCLIFRAKLNKNRVS